MAAVLSAGTSIANTSRPGERTGRHYREVGTSPSRYMFRPVRILSTGAFLPRQRLLSSDIDRQIGKPAGFVERVTGVAERPVVRDEDQVDMATLAARQALSDLDGSALPDHLLFAAAVPYQSIPATAPLVQHRLGLPAGRVAAFDINATCLSFLAAMDLGATLIAAGQAETVLLVSAEIASRALPWATAPLTAALFGDGAGAALLTRAKDDASGFVASLMETYPEGYEACRLGAGGTRYDYHAAPADFAANSHFEMDGKALYRITFQHFEAFLHRLLDRAGWSIGDVDLVLPHQASATALAHLVEQCGFEPARVIDIMRDHGNQVAASLPIVLDHARRTARLKPGMRVLMVGTSAGLSLGGLAFIA